jgi:hypothetical protein
VTVFNLFKVAKLLWPGNSPDLNAIEPCWWHMKRQTTKKGAATSKELEKWLNCRRNLDQESRAPNESNQVELTRIRIRTVRIE